MSNINTYKYTMNRTEYRQVKSMNKEQMEQFLSQKIVAAYNAGVSAMSKSVSDKVVAGIQKTKGIGEKRTKEIIDNINKEINGGDGNEETTENS